MECVKELMNMIVRQVRSEDRLDQCGVGRNTVFLTEADSAESILNRCGKRFQDVAEFRRHNRHRSIELHLILQFYEEIENRFALIFIQEMFHACFGGNKEASIGIRVFFKMSNKLFQDSVRDSCLKRRLLKGFSLR